jgi:hypothetical protein
MLYGLPEAFIANGAISLAGKAYYTFDKTKAL